MLRLDSDKSAPGNRPSCPRRSNADHMIASVAQPCGLSQVGSAVTDYFSDERMKYVGSDLLVCGPAIFGLFGGVAVPIVEAAFVFAAAQCVPNLIADALAPISIIPPVRLATSLVTPWGTTSAVVTAAIFGEKYFFTGAEVGDFAMDMKDLMFDRKAPDAFRLIKGMDLLKEFEPTLNSLKEDLEAWADREFGQRPERDFGPGMGYLDSPEQNQADPKSDWENELGPEDMEPWEQ